MVSISLKKQLAASACTLAVLALSACGSSTSTSGDTAGAAATASASSCQKSSLALHSSGVLTVATDAPAYSPYFIDNKPSNGKGFESAVAYAIGKQLGFAPQEVKWTVEPFNSSYAPGPKSFDFDINEISITPARSKEVDFSVPYYTDPQGVIVASGSSLASAHSLGELKDAKLGVQIGSTSLEAVEKVISPSNQPQVFNDSSDVVRAFKDHTVDAIVVDLATGFELVGEELSEGKIVGQFNAPGGDNWGVLLSKGSKLTTCVDKALETMRSSGTLAQIEARWMKSATDVPELR
jgi:polar amino acid transport system substrate-binding protein